MTDGRKLCCLATLLLLCYGSASAQQQGDQTCGQRLTEQLRRYSVKCLEEVASFVAAQPDMTAKIYGEKERYYLVLTRTEDGVLTEAVSRPNYPLMPEHTPEALKAMGWAAPENEADNWKKKFSVEHIRSGAAAQELGRALEAYGLKQGEAISLTVGPNLSSKPSSGG